jgi:6-phosphogluconolactonase
MGRLVYVGGYGSGISVYSREGVHLSRVGGLDAPDPSYLIADPDRRLLYAVNELETGTVTSYAVEPDGAPRRLSTQQTGGAEPCHLALWQGYLVAANYGSGSASVNPVDAGGMLDLATDLVRQEGHGTDPDRQAGPHAHQVVVSDDLVTVVDLGLDRLRHYRLDPATGRLAAAGETVAPAGCGPRHAVVHPSGRWYVTCELDSSVATFEPDPSTGALRLTATHSATLSTSDTRNYPADIALSGDGRFLYVGNRGADTIATFAVSPDGALEPVGEVGTGGNWPRQFAMVADPDHGELLYVANQRSDTVVALRIDPGSGLPSPTGEVVEVGNPSCVLVTDWSA